MARILGSIIALGLFAGLLAGCDDLDLDEGAFWPPRVGEAYPEITFVNYDGRELKLSDFAGQVVLVEPVGMTCEACNALSGGNERGGVGQIIPQGNLESLEAYIDRYCGGVTLDHPDVVLVQVLLYDLAMEAPDLEDAAIWAQHFGFDRDPDVFVVVPKGDLRGKASFALIPGVQLVDKEGVMRFDATGHRPKHNLWTELLPSVPWLIES